jgi:hypothetical protein
LWTKKPFYVCLYSGAYITVHHPCHHHSHPTRVESPLNWNDCPTTSLYCHGTSKMCAENYCATLIPGRVSNANIQLGFALFQLSPLTRLSLDRGLVTNSSLSRDKHEQNALTYELKCALWTFTVRDLSLQATVFLSYHCNSAQVATCHQTGHQMEDEKPCVSSNSQSSFVQVNTLHNSNAWMAAQRKLSSREISLISGGEFLKIRP